MKIGLGFREIIINGFTEWTDRKLHITVGYVYVLHMEDISLM